MSKGAEASLSAKLSVSPEENEGEIILGKKNYRSPANMSRGWGRAPCIRA